MGNNLNSKKPSREGLHSQTGELLNNPKKKNGRYDNSSSSGNRDNSAFFQLPNTEVDVTNIRETLMNPSLMLHFRHFLRTKIDNNVCDDPHKKKTSEQWLDFVILCEQVYDLPKNEKKEKLTIMVEIGKKFLGKPPVSYNLALQNQHNRKVLINHCRDLAEGITNDPDDSLLRDGYEYVYGKLDQKHDLFRKTFKPTTRVAAFMCILL